MTRAWAAWSSGKDSACALATVRADPDTDVVGLLTTLDATTDRVSMHGVRRTLLEAQAASLGLPLHAVELPAPCPNDVYEAAMRDATATARADGVDEIVFGDLFLADVREYRERALAGTGLRARFPLWGRATDALAREMLEAGVRAVVTAVDTSLVPASLAGRAWDERLLAELPMGADPCGERGELHTFVWDGPGFEAPVPVAAGARTERDGFAWCDLVATPGASVGEADQAKSAPASDIAPSSRRSHVLRSSPPP